MTQRRMLLQRAASRPRWARRAAVLAAAASLAACGPFGGKQDASTATTETTGAEGAAGPGRPEVAARTDGRADEPTTTAPVAPGGTAHWTYAGAEGPERWGDLDPAYATCKTGTHQSPIDITKGAPVKAEDLSFAYTPSAFHIVDNGHTVQVNLDAGGTMTLDGTPYTLVQFHFHAPSEHLMGGSNYPMELHLVHRNASGELAVVGAFIQKGETNKVLDAVLGHLPAKSAAAEGAGTFDATGLLPDYRGTIRYQGSLTTPPCTEGVHWNVLVAPIALAPEQIKLFTARYPHSNRPAQPLGDRVVDVDLETADAPG